MSKLERMHSATTGDLFEQLGEAEARFELREPTVQAFVPEQDRFGRLHREAEALQASLSGQQTRPPLFGTLVGVKDIFHVDGFVTRAGSRLPPEILQGAQAESVSRLIRGGALILGKTVTTEFAYFAPGPTRNPHNPEHTPGGSSSGSAAAVGAGLCDVALGTQTIGSIIRPASFCGVAGLKPTYERISRSGVIPLSPSLDHVGLFAPDAGVLARVAAHVYDEWDAPAKSLGRAVLGIPEGPYLQCASDSALVWFGTICDSLSRAGYELRRVPVMGDYPAIRARHDLIMSAEASQVHAGWFEQHRGLYAAKTVELIARGAAVGAQKLRDALDERDTFRADLRQTMLDSGIDLWICPSTVGAAPKGLDSTGDPVMNLPWTQAGLPALNLPAGKDAAGLPLGLQLVGDWGADESLLAWATELERVTVRA